jgi:hypothetical protein
MRSMTSTIRSTKAIAGLGLGLTLGCLVGRPNDDHCSYLDGDRTCADRYPGERTFCGTCGLAPARDGCIAQRPTDDACYSPCGDGTRIDDDAACLVGASSTSGDDTTITGEPSTSGSDSGSESSSGSTTGPMPCSGTADCTDAAAPFCEPVSGECVACDGTEDPDGACAGLDPGMPLCVGGACVQCTAAAAQACTGETPVCDDASNMCVPCTAHDQCGEAACNLFTGACLPADAVVHVGPGQRYTTLGEAVDSFDAGAEGTIVVHQDNYDEAATVDAGRTLAFLAADGDLPLWILAGGGSPQLVVGDATVLMDGIQISGNASSMHPGVRVDGGRAWVDRARIVVNSGGGVLAQAGAELVLRNCFMGGSINNEATTTVNGSDATILYSTLVAGFGSATAMSCDGAATVDVRNSILVAEAGSSEIQCSGATIEHTAAEMNLGGTNTGLGDVNTGWFADYVGGDLHLAATPPISIATTAQWETGDPPMDIDGEARPQLDGAPDVAGADVP